MRRGEVWWVDLSGARGAEVQKTRPAVIVSADEINARRHTVVVVPLSTGPSPRPPLNVPTPSAGAKSIAKCDQIRAVDKGRLTGRLGRLNVQDVQALETALSQVLQLGGAQ